MLVVMHLFTKIRLSRTLAFITVYITAYAVTVLPISYASPAIFPENNLAFSIGYQGDFGFSIEGEMVLPSRYWDNSLHFEVYTKSLSDIEKNWGTRFSGNALLFPALGTDPPLGIGIGADAGYSANGFNFHVGPVLGTDLLFSLDLPATVSTYLGLGYSEDTGFSLAWSGQLRYYLEEIDFGGGNLVFELATSDIFPLSFGLRWFFY